MCRIGLRPAGGRCGNARPCRGGRQRAGVRAAIAAGVTAQAAAAAGAGGAGGRHHHRRRRGHAGRCRQRRVPGHPDLRDVRVVNIFGRGATGSHATRVAGVAAARRNGYGMHGVAYKREPRQHRLHGRPRGRHGGDPRLDRRPSRGATGRTPRTNANSDPAASAHVANLSFSLVGELAQRPDAHPERHETLGP